MPKEGNAEHIALLRKGSTAWNQWRGANPDIEPDLRNATLRELNLIAADLTETRLEGADLSSSVLKGANLSNSIANDATLAGADLSGASLNATHFIESTLTNVVLDDAELAGTDFNRATLRGSSFHGAKLFQAVFTDVDMTGARHLETCVHESPSIIDSRTLSLSGGLPESFLRGCGLPDWLIEAYGLMQPDLSNEEVVDIAYELVRKRVEQVVQLSPLFISYSHANAAFVDALEVRLESAGIRFWRDVRHATAGRMEKVIDRAIRLNPTVLLVLSEDSVDSDWVEHEARVARRLEKKLGRDVLCPIALDDAWKTSRWPERLREQIQEYNILDFSDWEEPGQFELAWERLLKGLSLFYEPASSASVARTLEAATGALPAEELSES